MQKATDLLRIDNQDVVRSTHEFIRGTTILNLSTNRFIGLGQAKNQ